MRVSMDWRYDFGIAILDILQMGRIFLIYSSQAFFIFNDVFACLFGNSCFLSAGNVASTLFACMPSWLQVLFGEEANKRFTNWLHRKHGDVGMTQPGVGYAAERGKRIAEEKGYVSWEG